jgi:hypothetical protein
MKTLVALMHGTIAKKHTIFGTKFDLATIIGTKVGPACTQKTLRNL